MTTGLLIGLAALAAAQLLLIRWGLQRIEARIGQLAREQEEHYRQTEALFSLFAVLKPAAPFPPLRRWAISPDFALLLYRLVMEQRPATVLELGSGLSTLVLAYTLQALGTGRLVSLEHHADFAAQTRLRLQEHRLQSLVEVIHAPLTPLSLEGGTWQWYSPSAIPPTGTIDLLVVDGPPEATGRLARYPAVPVLLSRLSEQAIIVLDDADRPDEQAIADRWATMGFNLAHLDTEKGAAILRRLYPSEDGGNKKKQNVG